MANNTMARLKEEWRPVVGYEGYYEVSNIGRVKRVKQACGTFTGRILKKSLNHIGSHLGYVVVGLCTGGTRTQRTRHVHRLVAEAFLGPANGMEVNHIDGDKGNPRLSNLEYVTHAENFAHASRLGLCPRGIRHRCAKVSAAQVVAIRAAHAAGEPQVSIAKRYALSKTGVSSIVLRRSWAWLR